MQPTEQPIIEMCDVAFSYGEDADRALDGITLTIAPGSFTGIIGPSGAGKSTLAAVLAGAIPHHFTGQLFGATLVEGQDTCELTLTDISRFSYTVLCSNPETNITISRPKEIVVMQYLFIRL